MICLKFAPCAKFLDFFVEFGKVKILNADVIRARDAHSLNYFFMICWMFFAEYGIMKVIQSRETTVLR